MKTFEHPSANGLVDHHVEVIRTQPPRRRPWRAILALVVVMALIGGGIALYRVRAGAAPVYATTPVSQGTLTQTVSATGTVNPQNTIAVGSQVSGTISEIDADYNSKVHVGQVLAKLDPTSMQAALDSAKAALAQSQAQAAAAANTAAGTSTGVGVADANAAAAVASAKAASATAQANQEAIGAAQANVTKAQSAVQLAQQTVARDQSLLAQGFIPQAQADADQSALVTAQTGLQSATVAVQQAQAQAVASQAQVQASQAQAASQTDAVQSAQEQAAASGDSAAANAAAIGIEEAAVKQAQTNLEHTVITSPVDGTVVARDVSVGQTVAASLQTPTLFSIAQDLSKMEVDLAVGEPDIGNVHDGESVNFTVLAYPNRTFTGKVSQVRINPTTTNNVVTYDTVVLVNNGDGTLLPGMTANAQIVVSDASNALIVPVAALTYTPASSGNGQHRRSTTGASPTSAANSAASPWGATLGSASTPVTAGGKGRVFVERSGQVARVPVTVTLVSGTQAAVVPAAGSNLSAGDAVVTGASGGSTAVHAQRSTTASNPFAGGGAGGLRGLH